MARTIVVERITYRVCSIDGGRLLKTWARVGNKLKLIRAANEQRLRQKLQKISVDIHNGRTEAAELSGADLRSHLAAIDALKGLGDRISVDVAAREYVAARKELGAVSLMEAARFYRLHNACAAPAATLSAVIAEFENAIRPRSEAYRTVFHKDLKRLALAHGSKPVAEVTTADLEAFLFSAGQKIRGEFRPSSDFRRKQIRGELLTFFNFARRRRFLPTKLDTAAHALEAILPVTETKEVWDPEHLRRALESVWAHERDWLPWLAISAFANVRGVAAQRLTWEDVHWLDGLIELPARKSKVKQRVTIPISPSLADWLAQYRGRSGPICPQKGFVAFTARLRSKYGLPYYKNVLRRSYITYLLADTDDEVHVAHIANTSVAKLRANYRKIRTFSDRLVTKDLARAWFETARISAANIVQLELPA
ncbi:MAG TPA: hypothetical protein VGM54_10195 [Chthoniobacter sp.]|jgi:hypothetical protein